MHVLRRFCSQTFSVRLHPSPSVPVRSPPFYHILSYYSVLLRPLLSHPYPCSLSVISVSSFQPSTLGSDPFLVSSDLAFMLFLLLFGYNPYQPNLLKRRTGADVGYTEDGRDGRIGATKYAGGKRSTERSGKAGRIAQG